MTRPAFLLFALFASAAAACSTPSSDDGASHASEPHSGGGSVVPTVVADLDVNGDGIVRIGIAADGWRDDESYYQAITEYAAELSEAPGFGEVIVADRIDPARAEAELEKLANKPVDIVVVGSPVIASALVEVSKRHSELFWYCNCGSSFPRDDGYLVSGDDRLGVAYTAGAAAGILLQGSGGDTAAVIGCCTLDIEMQNFRAFQLGLRLVDARLRSTFYAVGASPQDFNDVVKAAEAYRTAVAEGADAVYPFLDSGQFNITHLGNDDGKIMLSAGQSDRCRGEGELRWQVAVRFDGADYVRSTLSMVLAGHAREGEMIVFSPGDDVAINGAVICGATPAQQEAMDAAYEQLASGALNEQFAAIAGAEG